MGSSGPVMGEPFVAYPGPRLSVGDTGAPPGSPAWKGVEVLDPSLIPSFNIIPTGGAFSLKLWIRTALPFVALVVPAATVEFHVHDLAGVPVMGSPFAGNPLVVEPTPVGEHGPDGLGDIVGWYSSTITAPLALPDGTYRITTVGWDVASNMFFYHDGVVVHVGP